jgi:hypothetical protein
VPGMVQLASCRYETVAHQIGIGRLTVDSCLWSDSQDPPRDRLVWSGLYYAQYVFPFFSFLFPFRSHIPFPLLLAPREWGKDRTSDECGELDEEADADITEKKGRSITVLLLCLLKYIPRMYCAPFDLGTSWWIHDRSRCLLPITKGVEGE